MTVLRRGNSKYWYIQFQFNGRTYIRSSRTTDRRSAEIMETDWRKRLLGEKVLGLRERISIGDSLHSYCESKRGTPNYVNIERIVRQLVQELPVSAPVDELTPQSLERLKATRLHNQNSLQTVKHVLGVIRGAVKHVKRLGYRVPDLEFPVIRVPKGRLRYLSVDEEQRLLKALDPRRSVKGLPPYELRNDLLKNQMQDLFDFVILLLDTGARYSEVAGLEWKQVNLKDRSIQLWRPKVQNQSVLFMTDRVYAVIARREQEAETQYVFTNKKGNARAYSGNGLKKAFRRAGLNDCSPHTLRHTHATRLIQNGLNIYEVKEMLGHSDIKTTMRYAHLEQRVISKKARDIIDHLNKDNHRPDLKVVK